MRSMEVTDEWLYQYMPVVDNAMIKALEGQVDEDYVFSKRFERKMKKVIRHEAHPMLTGAQQLLKRVAIFFTGIVCAGLVLTLSVDAYRDKFFMTLKTLCEDATQYNYSSEEKDAVLTPTIPTCIPEGYTETDRRDSLCIALRDAGRYRGRAIQRQTEETVLFFVKFSMKTMPENNSSGSKC